MELTGAQIVMRSLEDEGIKTIFGLPGGTIIPLYDAIYDSPVEHILVRHEQAAAHAADGFSRAGGGVGVCLATSGPGATNLITGIAAANHDSSPMLIFTGQVSTGVIGTDAFQEAHMLGISLPIVKHSMQIRSPEDIPQAIHDALHVASTGRPGPVLIDLPIDAQTKRGEYVRPTGTNTPAYRDVMPEDLSRIEEAADLIRRAKRPLVIAGNGINISRAYGELVDFAETLEIPVATSLLGKGAISDANKWSIGMIGMHGKVSANKAILNADVIVAVGTRFSERSTGRSNAFATEARVIHIDLDAAEIHKNIDASVWLVGDAKRVLSALQRRASGHSSSARTAWLAEIARMDEAEPLPRVEENGIIHSWQVFEAIDDVTKGELIMTTEVGQHQMHAALYHKSLHPRRFLTSGGQGAMGFGIPAAMGAHVAHPDMPIVCISGDGSAMMNIQELDTYARYKMPIKLFVLDNNCLGMVHQWQELFYSSRFSNTVYTRSPDFVTIARGMGLEAFEADDPRTLRSVVESAMAVDGPALVHIPIPSDELVLPMVPPGNSLEQMIVPHRFK